MASSIDPTKPLDGVAVAKGDLRANFQAAKGDIEALQILAPKQLASISAMTALASPVDGERVQVGDDIFEYSASSVAEMDGCFSFPPDENKISFSETAGTTTGFNVDDIRGDRGVPFQGDWAVSTSYSEGDLVRNTILGTPNFRWALQSHTSTANDEPVNGINESDFWAPASSQFVASLVPNDKGADLPQQNIVFGSFYFEYNGGDRLTDEGLHGHTRNFAENSSPVFYTIPNSSKYKPYRLIWHKQGRIRDNGIYGAAFGDLAQFLQQHQNGNTRVTYGFEYVTEPGRWVRQLSEGQPLTPFMIGCTPNDATVDNYDKLCWLINIAEREGRSIDLTRNYWYFQGYVVLPNNIQMYGRGREVSGLTVVPETTKSSVYWNDIYYVGHIVDPADYSDHLDSVSVTDLSGGVYKTSGRTNASATVVDQAYFWDSTNASFDTTSEVVSDVGTRGLTTLNVNGTSDQGGGVFLELPGTTKANEPRMFLGNAAYGLVHAGDAEVISLRDLEINGNASSNLSWLTGEDYSYFWLGGTGSQLSASLRETDNCCGLVIGTSGGRVRQPALRIYLSDMWIHNTIGSCLGSATGQRIFSGTRVKLGDSLSGRVKYGGSGTWVDLELHGRSRTSIHRAYSEVITGYKYKSDTVLTPIWDGNDLQQNILAAGVNRVRDPDFEYDNEGVYITGMHLDLRGSLFDEGVTISGSNVHIDGSINGADRAIQGQNSGTSGVQTDIDVKLTTENLQPSLVDLFSSGTILPWRGANFKITHRETYDNDGSGGVDEVVPVPALPLATGEVPTHAISVSQAKSALTGDLALQNIRDRYSSTWVMNVEPYVALIAMAVQQPALAADAVPTDVVINDSTFKTVANRLIGWSGFSSPYPASFADYGLRFVLNNVGFRIFDPSDTGGAISDTARRAHVGNEQQVDDAFSLMAMKGCYLTNTGGEMIVNPANAGETIWDTANFDPRDLSPKYWSERQTDVAFTATGSDLTDNGDGTFYYEVQPGLMWKPKIVNVHANNKVTSDKLIRAYTTTHRDAATDSPINPVLRIYFTGQFTASDAVSFSVESRVTH